MFVVFVVCVCVCQDIMNDYRSLTKLVHPHIVKLVAVLTEQEQLYLVFEFCDGSLLDLLRCLDFFVCQCHCLLPVSAWWCLCHPPLQVRRTSTAADF